jgi:hypothetical protein
MRSKDTEAKVVNQPPTSKYTPESGCLNSKEPEVRRRDSFPPYYKGISMRINVIDRFT